MRWSLVQPRTRSQPPFSEVKWPLSSTMHRRSRSMSNLSASTSPWLTIHSEPMALSPLFGRTQSGLRLGYVPRRRGSTGNRRSPLFRIREEGLDQPLGVVTLGLDVDGEAGAPYSLTGHRADGDDSRPAREPVPDRPDEAPDGRGRGEGDVVGVRGGLYLRAVGFLGDRLVERDDVELGSPGAHRLGQDVPRLGGAREEDRPLGHVEVGERLDEGLGDGALGDDVSADSMLGEGRRG